MVKVKSPIHMPRPSQNKRTLTSKAAEAQNKSLVQRDAPKITLPKAPWEKP